MLSKIRADRPGAASAVAAGLLSGAIVFAILRQELGSDFEDHVGMTADMIRTGTPPGNFLFYVTNGLLAGFSTSFWALKLSLVAIVVATVAAKAWLSIRFIASESRAGVAAAVVGLALTVTFSLPAHSAYLGQVPANVWHNSTTIFSMPFAVALFWTSLRYLEEPEDRWLWSSLGLAGLTIAAKPSFVLCFLPVFPVAALVRYRLTRPFLKAAALTVGSGLLLVAQYVYIYIADPTTEGTSAGSSGVTIDPLNVWERFSTDIPLSLLASFVFPLVALLVGGRAVAGRPAVRYALALAAMGVLEYALLSETGDREFDGNFTWQAIVTAYVLFLAVASAVLRWVNERGVGLRPAVALAALLAHVVGAGVFLHHWFTTQSLA